MKISEMGMILYDEGFLPGQDEKKEKIFQLNTKRGRDDGQRTAGKGKGEGTRKSAGSIYSKNHGGGIV